ncbi:MAG: hypothetical protein DCC49_07500 [Acidobacteria bacterium]|nr:MAG: hypothetical protein DCC49_07500 [Acidobacteriota bacterium]
MTSARARLARCVAVAATILLLALLPAPHASAATTWYFAEGTVRSGWVEYLTIMSLSGPQTITISFQASTDAGVGIAVPSKVYAGVAANTRVTFNVNDWLAANSVPLPINISALVTATGDTRIERPMYFNSNPNLGVVVNGGTDVVGQPFPDNDFYFAEGTVRPGFVEYLSIQNPNPSDSFTTITFQAAKDDGSIVPITPFNVTVLANSRYTFNVSQYVASRGINYPVNVSTKVSSVHPIVAERPMYFQFDPGIGTLVNGGTTVVGPTTPITDLYFAEGTVRPGYMEYLTIQNPGSLSANDVTISFQAADDFGVGVDIPPKHFGGADPPILANSRITFNVNDYLRSKSVPTPVNLAVRIQSDQPLVAERPMYFSANPNLGALVNDGTTVAGAPAPLTTQYFAEGAVRPGFVEYLTMSNPGGTNANVTIELTVQDDAGAPVVVPNPPVQVVQAGRRFTFNVSEYFASQSVAIPTNVSVKLTSTQPIVAERPMYFQFDPGIGTLVNGGTTVLGIA